MEKKVIIVCCFTLSSHTAVITMWAALREQLPPLSIQTVRRVCPAFLVCTPLRMWANTDESTARPRFTWYVRIAVGAHGRWLPPFQRQASGVAFIVPIGVSAGFITQTSTNTNTDSDSVANTGTESNTDAKTAHTRQIALQHLDDALVHTARF